MASDDEKILHMARAEFGERVVVVEGEIERQAPTQSSIVSVVAHLSPSHCFLLAPLSKFGNQIQLTA